MEIDIVFDMFLWFFIEWIVFFFFIGVNLFFIVLMFNYYYWGELIFDNDLINRLIIILDFFIRIIDLLNFC